MCLIQDDAVSKQCIQDLNPGIKKPIFIMLYCLCWLWIPAKGYYPKAYITNDWHASMPTQLPKKKLNINDSINSWFSTNIGILLKWSYT